MIFDILASGSAINVGYELKHTKTCILWALKICIDKNFPLDDMTQVRLVGCNLRDLVLIIAIKCYTSLLRALVYWLFYVHVSTEEMLTLEMLKVTLVFDNCEAANNALTVYGYNGSLTYPSTF